MRSSLVVPVRVLVLAVLLAAAVGCSKGTKKVTVQGTVSYKGVPVPSGILKFVGPDGSYSAASIQADGKYIMTDVVPGEVKVGVTEAPRGSGSSSGGKDPAPKTASVSLPEKYREPSTSGLTYTVSADNPELNIDIK